ncbi:MAG TPA: hypothetical protein VD816_13955 [Ohtaekwangia sp.]|nr:hypothetical protein [Ohtaekwangia sp.]
MHRGKEQLVVVFKKAVPEALSLRLMREFNVNFSEGNDNSKGRIYLHETGKKYIVTFDDADHKMAFRLKRYHFLQEIHDIYEPDWRDPKE